MADLRPQYSEEAVGANHPTKTDIINRAYNVEHNEDGTHGTITPTNVTSAGPISGTTGTFTGLITATGGQIAFPATAVPSADPNTLDDYEEGTWTPALTFGGAAAGPITYDGSTNGHYTKIGRLVAVRGYLQLTSKGTSNGDAVITSLPFAAGTDSGMYLGYLTQISFADILYGLASGTTVLLRETSNAGGFSTITDGNFADASGITFSSSYMI